MDDKCRYLSNSMSIPKFWWLIAVVSAAVECDLPCVLAQPSVLIHVQLQASYSQGTMLFDKEKILGLWDMD